MTDNSHHDPYSPPPHQPDPVPQQPMFPSTGPAAPQDNTQELPQVPPGRPGYQPGQAGMPGQPGFAEPQHPGSPVQEPFVAGGFPPPGDPGQQPPYVPPVAPGGAAGRPRRTGRTVAVVLAVVVVLAGVGAAVYFGLRPGDDTGTVADDTSSAPADDAGSSAPADDEQSTQPSDDASSEAEPTDGTEDGSGDGLASRPTKFGAWFAGDDKYEGKWDKPEDDGGQEITGYLVTDCDGKELATVEPTVFHVTVHADSLSCMSVQAVTEAGPGQTAVFEIG